MHRLIAAACAALATLAAVGLLASQPLAAQNAKAAQRELRTALREIDENPETGRRATAAIEQISRFDTRATAVALLGAAAQLAKQTTPITENRRRALLGEGGSSRLKRSRYELQNLDDAAEAVASALRKLRAPDAVRAMLQRLTDRGGTLPLWLRLQLAGRAGDLPSHQLDWRTRPDKKTSDDTLLALLTATAALGRRAAEGYGGAFVAAQLEHRNPDVRIAAARALGQLAWAPGIELLIPRVDAERGPAQQAVLDALVVLTGHDPGDSSASWRAWLAAEGGPFLRGEAPLGRGDAGIRKREPSGHTVSGSYFGIAQTGESILYVFDNSQSMRAKVGTQAKGTGPTTGGTSQTRWQLCRRELKSALRGLAPHKKFNLVSFANKARCFDRDMQPASKENIARAIGWLDSLKLEFQTNVFDALELAFVLAGRGTDDRYYPTAVDTIFFLSDGAPTIPHLGKGGIKRDDCDRILTALRRWNALGRITVHTIGIGLQARRRERNDEGKLFPPVFLRLMAEQNGGRYTARR